jgi:serine/threonine protein kinase/tetratricopeptide (TPR) repeat protein
MPADPQQVKSLFLAAAVLPTAERAAYLDAACGQDAVLRGRVEQLLQAHDQGLSFQEKATVGTLDLPGPSAEAAGSRIGPYKLLQQIGEGGMGTVWLADQQGPVTRLVALKLIKAGLASDQVLARFEQERQALALMDHPNIARVFDAGTTVGGNPYFVMELVKGVPITKFCDEHRLTPRQRLELMVPVCQAIQHAHQKGIIHRDIKPSNVLVASYDGKPVPKVIDFGVAKATGQKLTERTLFTGFGGIIGTLEYMSPEQAEFNALDIDTRSDIYALGVLLYELLTGTTPLTRKRLKEAGLGEALRLIREEEPPKPSTRLSESQDALPSVAARRHTEPGRLARLVRGELDWLVMKALEKDRSRRYETANGFALDIQRYLNDEPVLAGPPSAVYRLRKFARRHRGPLVAGVLLVAALLAGIVGTTLGMLQAKAASEAEAEQRQKADEKRDDAERARGAAVKSAKEAKDTAEKLKVALANVTEARATAEKTAQQNAKERAVLESIFTDLNPFWEIRGGPTLRVQLSKRLAQAAAALEGEAPVDPAGAARLQVALADTQIVVGYPDLAVQLCEKAQPTLERLQGANHPDTLRCLYVLGWAYVENSQPDLAVPVLETVLARSRALLGDGDAKTIRCQVRLAMAHYIAHRWQKSLALLEEAVTAVQARAEDGALFEDILGDLALAYQATGRSDLAVPLFERLRDKFKAQLGDDHPHVLFLMEQLGDAYRQTNRFDEAVALLEPTLARCRVAAGQDHYHTLTIAGRLATAYQMAGQSDRALPLFEDTVTKAKARFGPDHPRTLSAMSGLAWGYAEVGRWDEAVKLLLETNDRYRAVQPAFELELLVNMGSLGTIYLRRGEGKQARALLEQTFDRLRARLGNDHADTIAIMHNLALAYQETGRPDLALPLHEKALAKRQALLGDDHRNTLVSMSNLAMAYYDVGQRAKAVPLLQKALDGMTARLGADDPVTLGIANNLALAYMETDRLALALPLFEQTLAREKLKLGADDPQTLTTMNNLARAYVHAKRLDRALPLFQETLAKRQARLGADHPKTLITKRDLGKAYRAAGQASKALPLLEQALAKLRVQLDPDHRDTVITMTELARVYQETGQPGKAIALYEEALERFRARQGSESDDVISTMNNLGVAYWNAGRFDKSVPLFEELVRWHRAKKPADDPDTLLALANLAVNYRDSGRLAEALPLLEEALERGAKRSGGLPASVGFVPPALVAAYDASGLYAKSEPLYRSFVPLAEKRFGPDDARTGDYWSFLGWNLMQQKKFAAAEPVLRVCLRIREQKLPDAWITWHTRSVLGASLQGQRRYADAEHLLLAGYLGLKERAGQLPANQRGNVVEAARRLVELYRAWGRVEEAERWRKVVGGLALKEPHP